MSVSFGLPLGLLKVKGVVSWETSFLGRPLFSPEPPVLTSIFFAEGLLFKLPFGVPLPRFGTTAPLLVRNFLGLPRPSFGIPYFTINAALDGFLFGLPFGLPRELFGVFSPVD